MLCLHMVDSPGYSSISASNRSHNQRVLSKYWEAKVKRAGAHQLGGFLLEVKTLHIPSYRLHIRTF